MSTFSPSPPAIVVDANVAIWAILPELSDVDTLPRFVQWQQEKVSIVAPALWLAECTSVIRQQMFWNLISQNEGEEAIAKLFQLGVDIMSPTVERCRSALTWAERLQQSRAYDSFYLALANELNATFWTADQHLYNGAQQLGVDWVHWSGGDG